MTNPIIIPTVVKYDFIFETVIHRWILGFISLILSGAAIGILFLMGKGLWIAAGHLLGNF
jgi:hypothetical protein